MLSQGALKLISSYSSSSEDEDGMVVEKSDPVSTEEQPTSDTLPIPKGVLDMFNNAEPGCLSSEDKSLYEGRVRSFPHFPGNWSAHVYIPVEICSKLDQVVESLVAQLPSSMASQMHVLESSEMHLSLSRTVPIRHYWIEPIVEQLRSRTANHSKFSCFLHCPEWYVNDEKSRSFLGLKVSSGEKQLKSLVDVVDSVFGEFALPEFYKDPSFHVSIAWCLGDIRSVTGDKEKGVRGACISEQLDRSLSQVVVKASQVCCRIGNKMFSFPLR